MENIHAVISQQPGTITCNFEQVEAALDEKLKEYEGAVFTEESKQLAKKIVASLRAEKKQYYDNLKEAENIYMKNWNVFKPKAMALISKYDKPIDFINGQVKELEGKRVAEKKNLIVEIYEDVAAGLAEYIPFSRIYNQKWENATMKEKSIRDEMISLAAGTRQALETIRGMHSEIEDKALETYKNTLNLTDAIACINSYEAQKAEILRREQERQRQAEIERIRREEREKLEAEQRARAAVEEERRKAEEALEAERRRAEEERLAAVEQAKEEAAQEVIESLSPDMEEETALYEYRLALSESGRKQFEMYLDSVGIDWEMI